MHVLNARSVTGRGGKDNYITDRIEDRVFLLLFKRTQTLSHLSKSTWRYRCGICEIKKNGHLQTFHPKSEK